MPRGDRTGPWSLGPMTGRGMGYCEGFPGPGFMSPGPSFGFGFGRGMGRGMGGGSGRGMGRGWRRAGFGGFWGYPQDMPFWNPYGPPPSGSDFPQASPEEELKYLKEEEEILSQDMKSLKKRIEELEKKSKK